MKKLLVLLLVIAMTLTMVACNNKGEKEQPETTTEEPTTAIVLEDGTYELLIPNSYFNYFNIKSNELLNSLNELGSQYIISVEATDKGIILKADRFQLDEIIEKNDNDSSKYVDSFLEESDKNCFMSSMNYLELEFYCDKDADKSILIDTIKSMASVYCFNNMLYNRTSDWDINIKVSDYDTNEIIVEGSLLDDDVIAKLK